MFTALRVLRQILLLSWLGSAAVAADLSRDPYQWGAVLDVNRRYYWAGIPQSEGPAINPSLWGRRGTWRGELFINMGLADNRTGRRLDLIDVALARTWKRGRLEVTPSIEYYVNRPRKASVDPSTAEFSTRVAFDWGFVQFAAANAADVIAHAGIYRGDFALSVERTWRELVFEATANTGWASAGFNRTYAGFRRAALTFAGADFSISRRLGRQYFVRPHIELRRLLGSEMRNAFPHAPNWTFGVALGFER